MQARQAQQLRVAERLHAKAQSIDAGAPERGEPRLGDRLGIGFHRDFAILRHVEGGLAGLDDPRDLAGLEERRRPAAEIDRVGRGR